MIEIKNESMFRSKIDITKEKDVWKVADYIQKKMEHKKCDLTKLRYKTVDWFFGGNGTQEHFDFVKEMIDDFSQGIDESQVVKNSLWRTRHRIRTERETKEKHQQEAINKVHNLVAEYISDVQREIDDNHDEIINFGVEFAEDYLCDHNFDAPELCHAIIGHYSRKSSPIMIAVELAQNKISSTDRDMIQSIGNGDPWVEYSYRQVQNAFNAVQRSFGENVLDANQSNMEYIKIGKDSFMVDKETYNKVKDDYFQFKFFGSDLKKKFAKEVVKIIRKQLVGNLNK